MSKKDSLLETLCIAVQHRLIEYFCLWTLPTYLEADVHICVELWLSLPRCLREPAQRYDISNGLINAVPSSCNLSAIWQPCTIVDIIKP